MFKIGPNLGQAIIKLMLIPWVLIVGLAIVVVLSLPFFCSPIAQAVVFFFGLWLVRYWTSFMGPVATKFITAVYLLFVLQSVSLGMIDDVNNSTNTNSTCNYSQWPILMVSFIGMIMATIIAFLSSFLPYPRCNFMDARKLNRRVLRDSTKLVEAALSLLLLMYHRPDEDDGTREDDDPHSKVDAAELHHAQMLEHLLAHIDGDLSAMQTAAVGSILECGGCCCRGPKASVLSPTQYRIVQAISRAAYGFARTSLGMHESNKFTKGRLLRNFGTTSGAMYFGLLERRRIRQQSSVQLRVSKSIFRQTPHRPLLSKINVVNEKILTRSDT